MLGGCCVFYFYFYFYFYLALHSKILRKKVCKKIFKKGLILKYQTRKHRAKLPNFKG